MRSQSCMDWDVQAADEAEGIVILWGIPSPALVLLRRRVLGGAQAALSALRPSHGGRDPITQKRLRAHHAWFIKKDGLTKIRNATRPVKPSALGLLASRSSPVPS